MQATDIVVKNGSSVDKTFKLINPAAGLGGIATWNLKEGTISAVFPALTYAATKNGNGVRTGQLKFSMPSSFADSVTGLTSVGTRAEAHVTVKMPDTFPEALKDDFIAFTVNIINDALIRGCLRDAEPAT